VHKHALCRHTLIQYASVCLHTLVCFTADTGSYQLPPCWQLSVLREHQIRRCMSQHRFQARLGEACSHQAQKESYSLLDGSKEGCAVWGGEVVCM
jgi:hypothetical protein